MKIGKQKVGSENPDSKKIYQYDMNWNLINIFGSMGEASRTTGCARQNILKACRNSKFSFLKSKWSFLFRNEFEFLEKENERESVDLSEFLPITEYEEYFISKDGRVWSTKSNRFLVSSINAVGYYVITLMKDRKEKAMLMHRLLGVMFIQNPQNKPEINHKNGIKHDNSIENLEWVTPSENIRHSYDELGRVHSNIGMFGFRHNNAKIIYQYKDGVCIDAFFGINEASRKTGINRSTITNAFYSNRNSKAAGYIWKY